MGDPGRCIRIERTRRRDVETEEVGGLMSRFPPLIYSFCDMFLRNR